MPPSYQAPSVESIVGDPPESTPDHHMPPSSAADDPFTHIKPTSSSTESKHDPLTTNDHNGNEGPPDEAHQEADANALVLSSPPLDRDPHDESLDRKVPRELRTEYGDLIRAPSPSIVSDISGLTSRSAGSSGSGSTVTRRAHAGRRGGERHRNGDRAHAAEPIPEYHQGEITPRPLQAQWSEPTYSDAGRQAPVEHHHQQHHQPRGWTLASPPGQRHAATRSISSAGSSSLGSAPFSTIGHATDGSLSSPDRSEPADSPETRYAHRDQNPYPGPAPVPPPQHMDPFQFIEHGPGGPLLGPGPRQQQLSAPPHLGPQPSPGFHEQYQHPPRPDNLPRTGYEQLASWLTVDETGTSSIQPMYRRFETLNHRLLLHLQDELMELEEELRRLDAVDTQSRHAHHGFHPASRRHEAMIAGEMYYRKTDIFNMIGIKMEKYNQLLSSFGETQSLPSPHAADVDAFRDYLISHSPLVQSESRFLDIEEDLVSLSRPAPASSDFNSENLLTPMPRRAITFPPTPTSPLSDVGSRAGQRQRGRPAPRKREEPKPVGALPLLASGLAASFFLPILAFVLIPAFVGRLAVVFLMSVVTGVALLQTEALRHLNGPGAGGGVTDVVVCAGVYGAVMAVLAVLL